MDQTQILEAIRLEEQQLYFDAFCEPDAIAVGHFLLDAAQDGHLPIAIDVSLFDRPLFYCALPGTNPESVQWVRRKSNVVRRFYRSSYAVGLDLAINGTNLQEKYGLGAADYAAHGGSFPIKVKSCGVIGAITVTGLAQRDDHNLVTSAIRHHLNLGEAG